MAGCRAEFSRGAWTITFAAVLLASASDGRAQLTPALIPHESADYAEIVNSTGPPSSVPGNGLALVAPRVEYGLFDTMTESLFGDAYAEGAWRPLSLRTFFSEGWFEPWAG